LRAVIFDLWNTLIDWATEESDAHRRAILATTGHDPERFA
jgi:FMN phosphatase YigB (HAD superfamily)